MGPHRANRGRIRRSEIRSENGNGAHRFHAPGPLTLSCSSALTFSTNAILSRCPSLARSSVHGCVVAVLFLGWFWMKQTPDSLGEPNPAGGPAYAVSPTKSIPIPQREAPPNPVAHDTDSPVPTAPRRQRKRKPKRKQPEPKKDAFQIPDKLKPQKEQPHPQTELHRARLLPIRFTVRSSQAVSNPMYAAQAGAGQVGIGPNSLLGNRLGWYAQLIRDRLAQNWQTNGLSAARNPRPPSSAFISCATAPSAIRKSFNPAAIRKSTTPLCALSMSRAR